MLWPFKMLVINKSGEVRFLPSYESFFIPARGKGPTPPPPLLQKSCPQDSVYCLLVNLLLLEAPSGVISHDFWVGLGPLAVLLLQVVVLLRVVLPRRVAAPVVPGEGKRCHHGFQLHWSRVSYGLFVIGISSVSGGCSITSIGALVVYFQLLLFYCSPSLVLIASLSAQVFRGNSIPY
jgi:hypothetical protein